MLCYICCFCFQRNPSFSLCLSGVVYVMLHLLFLFSEESFLQSMLIWCCICYVEFVVFVFRGSLPSVFAHLVLYMLCYICFCFQRKPSYSLCSSGVVYVMLNLLFLFSEEAFLQSMLIWCCICYVTFVFVFRGSLPTVYAHLVLYMLC